MSSAIDIKAKRSLLIQRIFVYTFLAGLALLCVTPFYIMFINATRTSAQINGGISLFPGTSVIRNWISLMDDQPVGRTFLNSAVIAVSATLLVSYFSALTAYGFTIYDFKGKSAIYNIFIMAVMMVPQQLGLIGFYDLCHKLHILDSYIPLILPTIASPYAVFFLRQYMDQVINESVIQAGRIDGASELGIFHKIILPIVLPGVATNAIFAFVGTWNNYIGPLVILSTNAKKTLPMMIAELNTSTWRTDFGVLYLAVAISVVPILIVFAVFQKRILEGVAIGGTKE